LKSPCCCIVERFSIAAIIAHPYPHSFSVDGFSDLITQRHRAIIDRIEKRLDRAGIVRRTGRSGLYPP